MLHESSQEEIANRYFTFVNDAVGMLAVTLAATALQFEQPAPIATIFAAILLLWTQSKAGEYARFAERFAKSYGGLIGKLILLWRLRIYLLGSLAFWSVAMGMLTTQAIYDAWPF